MKKTLLVIFYLSILQIVAAIEHTGTISISETWFAADNPHMITGNITIQASGTGIPAVVTLEPGVEVKFDGDFYINIGSNNNSNYPGALKANGTEINPILFTSSVNTPTYGAWNSIRFYNYAVDDSCLFEHTLFEYGGSSNPMIYLTSASPSFDNCTFQIMNQPAIAPANNASGAWISNCTFENGNDYPLIYYAGMLHYLGSGNSYSANAIQAVRVYGELIPESQFWTSQTIPFRITNNNLAIEGNSNIPSILTIDQNSILEFDTGLSLIIGHWLYSGRIGGIMADNVIFKGVADSVNAWFGIRIRTHSLGDSNRFENCTFQNGSFGIYAEDNSSFHINNSTFTGNAISASVMANQMYCFETGNSYTENNDDRIEVHSDVISNSAEWTTQNTPLHFTGIVELHGAGYIPSVLTLNPGAILEFDPGAEIKIGHWLYSDRIGGIVADNVTFQGVADSANAWFGVRVRKFSYNDSSRFDNCTFQNASYGIYAEDEGTFQVNNSTFTGNTVAASAMANDIYCFETGNIYTGNSDDRIEVRGDVISNSAIWTTQDTPLHLTGIVEVNGYDGIPSILTINSGTILEFDTVADLKIGHWLYSDRIGGIMADNVVFQGSADSTNAWFGIRLRQFSYGDSSRFDNCTFKNGSYGIYVEDKASFHLNNSTFTGNAVAASVLANEMYCFEAGNIYTDNTDNRIEIRGDIVSNSAVWTTQATPLHILGNVSVYDYGGTSHLEIQEGAQLEFASNTSLSISHYLYSDRIGSLSATGVEFKGDEPIPGFWAGILFEKHADSENCILDRCIIEYAGSGNYGNIYCDRVSPLIQESIIRHSSNYGIRVNYAEATPTIYQCSIFSNDIGIYCGNNSQPTIGGAFGNSNAIVGNTTYGVQNVSSGVIIDATNNWWGDASGPYDPNGTIEVPPCGDPVNDMNIDGLGDNISDYIDYCTWNDTPLGDAPSLFDLLSPVQADTVWNLIAAFNWETSIDPTANDTVFYKLEISSSSGYEPENTLTIDNLLSPQYQTTAGELNDDIQYWWRVTAFDTQGQYTNCNQQNWCFNTFVIEPPNNFALLTPGNLETVMLTSPLLTWEEAVDPDPEDSVIYTVYLDETSSFTNPDSIETTETGVYPPFCTPEITYYWKVEATDSFGYITWSNVFSFQVHADAKPRPPVDITVTVQNNDILLNWEEVPGADYYCVYHSNEPYSGFLLLQDDITILEHLHVDAFMTFDQHFYNIIANDIDLRYWRDLSGEKIEFQWFITN